MVHDGAMAGRLDDVPRIDPGDRAEWRAWLEGNHATATGVWVVQHKRSSSRRGVAYEDLVLEALCFGWVDGTQRRLDDERTVLYVARRRPGGTWARSNKERVERLMREGLMTPAGLAAIEAAKANGSWTILDSVEALEVPDDLAAALDAEPGARAAYEALSPSARRLILWSVISAKRPETRARRITAAVAQVTSA